MNRISCWSLGLVVLCAASGCPSVPAIVTDAGSVASTGTVSGQLTLFTAGAGLQAAPPRVWSFLPALALQLRHGIPGAERLLPAALRTTGTRFQSGPHRFRSGELLVRLKARASRGVAADFLALQVPGYRLHLLGSFAQTFLVRVENAAGELVNADDTEGVRGLLAARSDVAFAEVNALHDKTAVPDDALYARQWHFAPINLPAAWDVTTGSASVTVAVIDTGIKMHPDFDAARFWPGYDMISDAARAQDGDGRDADPTDEGNDEPNGSSWHGTHVTGTIGAASNNTNWVTGVDWTCKILPVRALGKGGGTSFDIASAMAWAVGEHVSGVPDNAHPAQVVNMSLGGSGAPVQAYQDVIDYGATHGAIFVVAAGNNNEDAANTTPCNQPGVLCVGAVGPTGVRAPYSNFGAAVTVMAPGGDMTHDLDGDGYPDGVLSTYLDANGGYVAGFLEGTSMASPHVAGVVALMKSKKPGLSAAEAKSILQATANTAYGCPEGCGAGLLDAYAAVQAAAGASTGVAHLSVSTLKLSLSGSAPATLNLTDTGGDTLNVDLAATGTRPDLLTLSALTVTLTGNQSKSVQVTANTSALAPGTYSATLHLTPSVGAALDVAVTIGVTPPLTDKQALYALMKALPDGGFEVAAAGYILPPSGYKYSITVDAGTFLAIAAVDDNGNGQYFDPGERVGFYRNTDDLEPLEVKVGQETPGISFNLIPYTPLGSGG